MLLNVSKYGQPPPALPSLSMKTSWLYIIIPILIGLAVMVYLFQWQAIYAYWPFLLILLCPLMMMGMHGGHGGSHSHSEKKNKASEDDSSAHHG